ncbi:hypothetical protein C3495_14475 (plasmid) [Clostridiaceae bacterium 14S0207]|nr:hypothetical protein C3495_14475 [Clostridiaceae bacterium 14S0207]
MKITSETIKKAHKMTKEIKNQYAEVNYKFQLGLCLSYLLKEKGENEMVELKGTEKQIKYATDLREDMLKTMDIIEEFTKLSKVKDDICKLVSIYRNYISRTEDSSRIIAIWKFYFKEDLLSKCLKIFRGLICYKENPHLFKFTKEEKEILESQKELLDKLVEKRFRRIIQIYGNKTGKHLYDFKF